MDIFVFLLNFIIPLKFNKILNVITIFYRLFNKIKISLVIQFDLQVKKTPDPL